MLHHNILWWRGMPIRPGPSEEMPIAPVALDKDSRSGMWVSENSSSRQLVNRGDALSEQDACAPWLMLPSILDIFVL
jgi:hypothetical protein